MHVTPSGEVKIVPKSPTAMNIDPDQTMLDRPYGVPEACGVRVTPSGEVRKVPKSHTAINGLRSEPRDTLSPLLAAVPLDR